MTEETITKEKTVPRELGECPVCKGTVTQNNQPVTGICKICGKPYETYYTCENGCSFCDSCYGTYAFIKLTPVLKTQSKNPVKILNEMMADESFGQRGCVHCAAVPLSIILAYKNLVGITDKSIDILNELFIKEISRTPISMCKINGHCGIAVSCGNALSSLLPVLDERYKDSNIGEELRIECIKAVEGIRDKNLCCKMTAYEEITAVTDFINRYLWVELNLPSVIKCEFSQNNPYCQKENCRFYDGLRMTPLNDIM